MKIAFLYAGQGSQRVGMGEDFYEKYPTFKAVMDSANADFDIRKTCFEGPEETLSRTFYTQPCMLTFAAGVTALLNEQGIFPEMVAGLSLGEYSALHAAGVLDFETALDLIRFRAQVMEEAVGDKKSAMAAIMQLERDKLQRACDEASSLGVCQIANYNCPGQLVIGGEETAVNRAVELATEYGARRCVPLNVSGPFHTALMAPAGDALRGKLKDVQFGEMKIPVLFNCLGDFKNDDDTIADLLEKQVQSSVYMEDTISRMAQLGVDTIIEIGPGKTLSGFVRKTAKGIKTYAIDTAEDFAKTVAAIKEAQA